MKQRIKRYIFPIMAVSAVSAFPALFLYCQNADEAGFGEIVPVLLGYLAVGILLFVVCRVILRSITKAALVSIVFIIILLNFSLLEKMLKIVFPSIRYWHSVPIILVVGVHIAYFVNRLIKEEIAEIGVIILSLVFGCLIAMNVILAVPSIIGYINAQSELVEMRKQKKQTIEEVADVPNVYLLIFDEYANFPEMEELYNYDNAPLKDFLNDNNFNIDYSGHNESILSHTVQANMVQLDYVVSDSSSTGERNVLRHNGTLFEVMRNHGYQVQILEDGDFYGGSMPQENKVAGAGATTINGESMQLLLCQRTMLYPLFKQNNTQRIKNCRIIADYLCDRAGELKGTFTLAYFGLPHQPFIVDENGREVGMGGYSGPDVWTNKDYYLGQYKYTTSKLILPILESIVTEDPEAIIILMSDHGARGTIGATWEMKTNSLNAVYYQGEEIDNEGLSNVNTIRLVLNKLFGLNYKMIDVPISEEGK